MKRNLISTTLFILFSCLLRVVYAQTGEVPESTEQQKLRRLQTNGLLQGNNLQDLPPEYKEYQIVAEQKLKAPKTSYCASGSLSCGSWISQVTLTGSSVIINNTSNCTAGGYNDYSAVNYIVHQGDFLVLEIANGNPQGPGHCGVWVDWNQNGDFLDDDSVFIMNGPEVFMAVFEVPSTVMGNIRMRIKITDSLIPDPCNVDSTGETEDYSLQVMLSNIYSDIAITALLNPLNNNSCPIIYYPAIELTNLGTIPLGNFPVSYSIDGTIIVTDTFYGVLDTGASVQYAFSQYCYLTFCNLYHFKFLTSVNGDIDTLNNSLQATFNSGQPLNVIPGGNIQQLVNAILPGTGLTISNITATGHINARGKFYAPCPTIGLDSGIVIGTGYVTTIIGPNNSSSAGNSLGLPGDIQLNQLINDITRDASVLEFDLVPQYDSIKFRYIFGSEEYPEWVNSYNDVFAFFVTGPAPDGNNYVNKNIAIIPGTLNTPVSINNINNGHNNTGPCVHCNYYVHNTGNETQLDAFTAPLTASFTAIPGASYHLKFAIADTRDYVYDSDVFLEAGSFYSPSGSTSISGQVQYDNIAGSPLRNSTVYLKQDNQLIAQTTTNDFGHYQFDNVPSGTYSLEASTTIPWGGGNSTDALLILKHFVGMQYLYNLPLLAADASGGNFINSLDALLVVRRFVGLINSFPCGYDWIFESPEFSFDGMSPVIQNIRGICVGDVNQSYTP